MIIITFKLILDFKFDTKVKVTFFNNTYVSII